MYPLWNHVFGVSSDSASSFFGGGEEGGHARARAETELYIEQVNYFRG